LLQYEWFAEQVYVTVERPSVCPSVFLIDRQQLRRAAGLLLSALQAGDRYRSTAAGAVQPTSALSSKCGQRHFDSRRRRLNTYVGLLLVIVGHSSGRVRKYVSDIFRVITTPQPGNGTEYFDKCACLSACLCFRSVSLDPLVQTCSKFSVCRLCCSILFWPRCDTLCASGSVYDVIFSYNGPSWRHVAIPRHGDVVEQELSLADVIFSR